MEGFELPRGYRVDKGGGYSMQERDIDKAMRVGIQAVCELGAAKGIKRISAGNYGGKLGPFHYHLKDLLP